jgi:hypothetical protein
MKLSPLTGAPIAETSDFATDYPVTIDEPRTALMETFTVVRFADADERDAKILAPALGQVCQLQQPHVQLFTYTASGWRLSGGAAPNAFVSWTGLAIPGAIAPVAQAPLTTADVRGGCTVDPVTGHVTVPHTGLYRIDFGITCEVVGAELGIGVGTPTTRTEVGLEGGLVNGKAQLSGGITKSCAAGDVLCPWVYAVGGANTNNQAYFQATFCGSEHQI